MALAYDFDMFSIIPREVQAQFGGMLSELGMADKMSEQVALFRDPATAEALRGSSEAIQKCFLDSGFGLNVYDSGAGPGHFPASDGPARAQVIERLLTNLEALPEGLNWNGFDIESFAMSALSARPLDTPAQSLSEMRAAAEPAAPGPAAETQPGGMDQFFSNTPPTPQAAPAPGAGTMDAFFSGGAPGEAPVVAAQPEPQPDMDSFFSSTAGSAATGAAPPKMTAQDVRMTIDTSPPKKVGLSPMKMALMAAGLYMAIAFLTGGAGTEKLVEFATGGQMVAVSR